MMTNLDVDLFFVFLSYFYRISIVFLSYFYRISIVFLSFFYCMLYTAYVGRIPGDVYREIVFVMIVRSFHVAHIILP
jgi:hypothetical protein